MSYKSLLFCPDEKAAQVVTQVLSELEFSVEIALETFATVKKLTDEHFDALVVDCHNEQDASLLFKAARNSAHNHSSLSVAVVEGQTGVAKAFRIGANLVLTKPINIEQSKSTLRVAKGLLRKSENRGAALASSDERSRPTPSQPPAPPVAKLGTSIPEQSFLKPAVAKPAPGIVSSEPHIAAPSVPYAGLEVENDPIPEPEAADVAVLESMPKVVGKPASEPMIGGLAAPAQPIAASTAGYGAAAAPALEKKPAEMKLAGAAPMVTNEPIVRQIAPELEPVASVPTFSSLEAIATRENGSGKGFLRVALTLFVIGAAGYFGWQKFQPLQYLHRNSQATEPQAATPDSAASSLPAPVSPSPQNPSASASNGSDSTPSITLPDPEPPAIPATPRVSSNSVPQEIEVQEMPITRDMKVPPPTKIQSGPTAQPLVVKSGTAGRDSKAATVAPPQLMIAAPSNSNAALSKLVSADPPLPQPASDTVRVSQGVSQGLLLKKVSPIYPPMALQLHKEGVVQLLATITKRGDIGNVKVLSGDSMLARAAADAVLRWKYRPYLLNGNPVEIETQISIVFKAPQ